MKTQMKFQKIFALVTLITTACAIVLALCFNSGLLNAIRPYAASKYGEDIWGADALYRYSQSINDMIVIVSIVLLLTAVLLYVMGCQKRRNYYITNYIAIGVFAACAVVYAIIMIIVCANCFALRSLIDFDAWIAFENEQEIGAGGELVYINTRFYNGNISTLVLGILLSLIVVAEAVMWVLNLVWKLKLMKGEKELLAKGGVDKVADLEVA